MERDYDREYERQPKGVSLRSTGGAVPIKNSKGEITMQKVKVQRYIAGKRPKYAGEESEEEEVSEPSDTNDEETTVSNKQYQPDHEAVKANTADDRRLKRLEGWQNEGRQRPTRHRHIAEPEILMEESESENEKKDDETAMDLVEESEEEELESFELKAARRLELKKKALQRQEELLAIEEEQKGSNSESEESDEYEEEEYSDSEDEITPRLKPVFVRKTDRVTIREKEIEEEKEKQLKLEKERLHIETKKQTKKIIEEEVAKEKLSEKITGEIIKCDFETDDENEEDYELWKLRELKRIKRDREEKEALDKEKQEIQKVRNMTEEERQNYLRDNPKLVTNRADKGKYKFLQKYYHRGAFFLDKDEEVLKRSTADPTLEDHFDKTILPKVMQVKNFGLAGRTKYTHLLDQDTTRIEDNPWFNQEKFIDGKGGGTKQVFDKPTAKKRK